uniref:Uncharacterized protein n=1 Tax=Anguilla anguilla TaxID=7936 RepID=A0A0E9UP38_ANGAN
MDVDQVTSCEMVKWPFIRGILEWCSIWQEVGGKYPVMRPCRKPGLHPPMA